MWQLYSTDRLLYILFVFCPVCFVGVAPTLVQQSYQKFDEVVLNLKGVVHKHKH